MAYGIDDIIQQKTDAYRGNPAALQQRHAQSKELIDLLALQKLKSEKDSAARNMQMQMQQQPGTIAQQLESEMVGRTKDEMLQGVAGVMKNNQARQQRVASLGIAPQPRPNMQRMAQGGIVGFANGGQATFDKIEAIRADDSIDNVTKYQKIQALLGKAGYSDPDTLDTDAKKQQKVRAVKDIATDPTAMNPTLDPRFNQLQTGPTRVGEDADYKTKAAINPVIAGMKGNVLGTGALAGKGQVPDPMAGIGDDMLAGLGGPAIEEPEKPSGDPAMEALGKVDAAGAPAPVSVNVPTAPALLDADKYKPDYTKADELNKLTQDKFTELMNQDPAAAAAAKRAEALKYIDYTADEKALRQANIDELKALEESRFGSADKLKRDNLTAFLLGARGTDLASTLRAGAGQAQVSEAQQQAGIESLMDKRQKAQQELMKESQQIRTTAYSQGTEAEKQAYQNVRTGVTGIQDMSEAAQTRAEKDADKLLQVDSANLDGNFKQRRMELDAALQIANQAFQGELSQFKAQVQKDIKMVDAVIAADKNRITENYYKDQSATNLTKVLEDIEATIGNITNNYNDAFKDVIAQAELAVGKDGYEGSSPAELRELKQKAIDATTVALVQIRRDAKARLSGMTGGLSATRTGP